MPEVLPCQVPQGVDSPRSTDFATPSPQPTPANSPGNQKSKKMLLNLWGSQFLAPFSTLPFPKIRSALWIPFPRGKASSLQWGYAQGPPTNPHLPPRSRMSQEQLSLNPGGEDCGVGSPELGPKLARRFLHYVDSKRVFIACEWMWDLPVLM